MKKETPAKKIWILTREHNDYDQHGDYLVAVFADVPTIEQIIDHTKGYSQTSDVHELLKFCLHIQNGGGRRNDKEDVWFNLNQAELL